VTRKFEVFTAVKIQVEVFWVLTPFSVVVGHQRFRGLPFHITTRCHNPEELEGTWEVQRFAF